MKTEVRIIRLLVVSACMVLVLASSALALVAPRKFRVEPRCLGITMLFHGGRVTVSDEIPRGANAIAVFKGTAHKAELVRKGRRWGLWMGVGEVSVANAPSLYLVMSTDSQLLSKQNHEDRWGYGALREQVKFSGAIPKAGKAFLFEQFLKFKESEGLYGVFPRALKVVGRHNDAVRVEGNFALPGNISPDQYQVDLYVLKGGKIVEHRSIEFPVKMKRVAAFLSSLAFQHGTLYGLLAVFIAMVMGFVTGHIFQGRRAH